MSVRARPTTKTITVNTDVDVELTAEDLADFADFADDEAGDTANRRALLDWHDKAHGLSSWQGCSYEPCNLLSLEYRETP